MNKDFISSEFQLLQDRICKEIETIDGLQLFIEDKWTREEGGGGRTRIIQNGSIIEKGGVAFSKVNGPITDLMKKQMGLDGNEFFATGVSIVLHPTNPHIPIIHMNVRYFEMDNGEYWFGGGIDLTPHYIVPEQAKEFHLGLKNICDKYNLVNDRGTKFGLVSGGRTESILMSLPANASWEYNYLPINDSKEIQTLDLLKKGLDWML